jgi:hypothetical protein
MSEQEEKAQKLKEIQERLAEIQKKSKPGSDASEPPRDVVKKDNDKAEEPTIEIKKDVPEDSPAVKQFSSTKPINPPIKVKAEINPPKKEENIENKAKEVKKEIPLTQEETNWRANKMKNNETGNPARPKRSTSSTLSKIYTILSLVITVLVLSYLASTYFLSSDHEGEVVVSDLPETIEEPIIEDAIEEDEIIAEVEVPIENDEVIIQKEAKQEKIVEKKAAMNQTVVRERKAAVNPPSSTNESVKINTAVPKGIIISYASNSSSEMATKNVNYLKSKGFKSAYYYMPDKEVNSPKLYKVYVGPFNNDSEAMPEFRKVVALNDKAFILRMD